MAIRYGFHDRGKCCPGGTRIVVLKKRSGEGKHDITVRKKNTPVQQKRHGLLELMTMAIGGFKCTTVMSRSARPRSVEGVDLRPVQRS
jgi:hypothetical protein